MSNAHLQSTPIGSSTGSAAETQAPPPSIVAAGTGVPAAPIEHAEAQQAATAPGTGGIVEQPASAINATAAGTGEVEKVSFKEQVNGYAKKIAGTVFNNDREKEFGDKKLNGEV